MSALDRFVDWLASYTYRDLHGKLPAGLRLQYHSRSDEHSKKLGELIVDDLLDSCQLIREQAARGEIAYGINYKFTWANGKAKTIDLAIGIPLVAHPPSNGGRIHRLEGQSRSRTPEGSFKRLLIACEEKAVMTEHGKSQPRVYSELNDSHTIVHSGDDDTIAVGITMVNIASTFVSPLRQIPGAAVRVTQHHQPDVTQRMIDHLRQLPVRDGTDAVGFDAYCTFVLDLDNQGHVRLHTALPAPQAGNLDHYDTFLERICHLYSKRFSHS